MPIEIKELVVKVNVNQNQNQSAAPPAAGLGNNGGEEKTALVKEAVEETLRMIENKKER
jgi:hypothetical protein